MFDSISASTIKDSLTNCPTCKEEFNGTDRLPRRMPCCVLSVCQLCLHQYYNTEKKQLSCPYCRHDHHMPYGVTSIPTEPLNLKILDHLKIQKGLRLPCTDCPDKNEAIARCVDCCIFLCEECHRAHVRHRSSRDHETLTFDETKDLPMESVCRLHQCLKHQQSKELYCFTCSKAVCQSCTVAEHDKTKGHTVVSVDEAHQDMATSTNDTLTELGEKVKGLHKSLQQLGKKKKNIYLSRQKATADVNQTFDNMAEVIQNRRATLLSIIEDRPSKDMKLTKQTLDSTKTLLTKVTSSSEYMRQIRKEADKIEDLQLMVSSAETLKTLLEEASQDAELDRTAVSFVPDQLKQGTFIMEALGAVRTVTFAPSQKPPLVPASEAYNCIIMVPAELPPVADMNKTIPMDDEFICPHLEWDSNTASDDITISSAVITNTKPNPPPPDTGCRIQALRRVLTSRPLVVRKGQRAMFQMKIRFSLKQVIPENRMIFESALTRSPVDTCCSQSSALSVRISSSSTHEQQMCLKVVFGDRVLADTPIIKNQSGESRDLNMCFLLDGNTNKIHLVEVDDVKVISSVTGFLYARPLWVLMCLGKPTSSDMACELVSGKNMSVSKEIGHLLLSLYKEQ